MLRIAAFLILLSCLCQAAWAQASGPAGHSHNDYLQAEPFRAALKAGMRSIEADLFWVDGELLVGHSRGELSSERDFDSLYWLPLAKASSNLGTLELLIDIKSEPDLVVPLLLEKLKARSQSTALLVLSGKRASQVPSHPNLTQEGTVNELLGGQLPAGCRYVSGQWSKLFDWDGEGQMPADQYAALKSLVEKAHSAGLKLRLWDSPDGASSWEMQWRAGVDRINTDLPEQLGTWLQAKRSSQ